MRETTIGDRDTAIRRLAELIKDIQFAMMTTVDEDGAMHSRPMATQTRHAPFDGDLWFFTRASSHKTGELGRNRSVNLSYASPDDNRFVSISGTADVVRDRGKAAELWNPVYRAWFPDGLDDPELVLIRVRVERAEFWDASSSTMVQVIGFVKAMMTGTPYEPGAHGRVEGLGQHDG